EQAMHEGERNRRGGASRIPCRVPFGSGERTGVPQPELRPEDAAVERGPRLATRGARQQRRGIPDVRDLERRPTPRLTRQRLISQAFGRFGNLPEQQTGSSGVPGPVAWGNDVAA